MPEQAAPEKAQPEKSSSEIGGREASIVSDHQSFAPIPPSVTGLRGVCPRCGEGRLFKGFLGLQPTCHRCGLDFSFIDAGDGPAVFVIFIVATVVVGLAIAVEFTFAPPLWVHILIWWPIILLMCLSLLRPIKGLMVALQYATKAAEGRLDTAETRDDETT